MAAWYFYVPSIIWVLIVIVWRFNRWRKEKIRQQELNQANQNSQVFVVQPGNPL